MTSNYVPGLRLEFARFYGETGHFKLDFFIENSNFSQFFLSGIHIHTFSHNFAGKKISFHRHFKNILNNFQLKDIWRYQNPDKKEFTFYSNVGTASRLDKFYLTKDLTQNVIESKIQNFAHSDHDKVNIKLDLSEIERGPGLWKINNSYLHDPDYVKEITRMWYLHQFKKDENDNLNGWWEEGKIRIKEISLNFSKRKNRENKNYKHNLRKQFRNVKNKLDRDPSNVNSKYLYNKINQEIKQVEILEAEGAKIRSKAQWREEGETSSRYFCSLEKKRGAEKSMRSVQRVKDISHVVYGMGQEVLF